MATTDTTTRTAAALNIDWHGVPAGTALTITGRYTDVQGNEILVVERADGAPLPGPWGADRRTNIAAEFITTAPAAKPAKPLPKTLPAFNRRLAAEGIPVEVVQGEGYVYLCYEDGNPNHYTSHSIMTPRFSDMPGERWMAEVVEFRTAHEVVLAERAERPAGPLKLRLGR